MWCADEERRYHDLSAFIFILESEKNDKIKPEIFEAIEKNLKHRYHIGYYSDISEEYEAILFQFDLGGPLAIYYEEGEHGRFIYGENDSYHTSMYDMKGNRQSNILHGGSDPFFGFFEPTEIEVYSVH